MKYNFFGQTNNKQTMKYSRFPTIAPQLPASIVYYFPVLFSRNSVNWHETGVTKTFDIWHHLFPSPDTPAHFDFGWIGRDYKNDETTQTPISIYASSCCAQLSSKVFPQVNVNRQDILVKKPMT
jgi:hypothetical protein